MFKLGHNSTLKPIKSKKFRILPRRCRTPAMDRRVGCDGSQLGTVSVSVFSRGAALSQHLPANLKALICREEQGWL